MITAQCILTESCNLKCSYCYVNQKNNILTEGSFQKGLKNFKEKVGENTPYQFDFFGGEPLLNWGMVTYITDFLKYDPFCVKKQLVTNGLLLNQEKVDFLKKNKIECLISFDGLWSEKRGYGLIPKYKEKVYLFKQLASSFNCMIHPDNLNLVENYKFFTDEFDGMCPSYKLIQDSDAWKKEHISIFRKEFKDLITFYENNLNLKVDLITTYLYYLKNGLIDKNPIENCGAGSSLFCFSNEINLYPCERFATSNIENIANTQFKECLECDLKKVCKKGCLYENSIKGINKNLCEIYKIIFEEVIDLNNRLKNNATWKKIVNDLN